MSEVQMNQPFLSDLAALLQTNPEAVTRDYTLSDENWDSVAVISAIALIDKHFGVTVPGTKLAVLSSAGQLFSLVESAKRS